jgi:hypothetical protein
MQGASTLSDVLKVNTSLQYLYCENNGIALTGFTDLVNSLHRNTTLLYLPAMQESRQMALKQTEDQVKQMRDDVSIHNPSATHSVRSKLASKMTNKTSRDKPHPMGLSDQDIKAALGLVDESWARQAYRLQQYLQRNYNIANGIPTTMDVDEEEFERPDTATSLGKILEKVQIESTPTVEKNLQLGTITPDTDYDITPLEKELEMSFGENRRAFPFDQPPMLALGNSSRQSH